ncbi:MAG TPA: hypothetical protein EYP10_07920 [Armatimonadetes bacterium]|nr:hypothetical protein [Armatimonadota bacterium]
MATQAVKAVARKHRWFHGSHRALFEVANRLVQETGDDTTELLFEVASALHQNFYEDWMPLRTIQRSADAIRRLRECLFALIVKG